MTFENKFVLKIKNPVEGKETQTLWWLAKWLENICTHTLCLYKGKLWFVFTTIVFTHMIRQKLFLRCQFLLVVQSPIFIRNPKLATRITLTKLSPEQVPDFFAITWFCSHLEKRLNCQFHEFFFFFCFVSLFRPRKVVLVDWIKTNWTHPHVSCTSHTYWCDCQAFYIHSSPHLLSSRRLRAWRRC